MQSTGIKQHLEQMADLLCQEEEEKDPRDPGAMVSGDNILRALSITRLDGERLQSALMSCTAFSMMPSLFAYLNFSPFVPGSVHGISFAA